MLLLPSNCHHPARQLQGCPVCLSSLLPCCAFTGFTLQTLLDDPDLPGYQPALPKGFDLQEFARQVEAEQQEKAKRKRGLF